jgi:5-methylcytosine-specific restriction endonuclease McrA
MQRCLPSLSPADLAVFLRRTEEFYREFRRQARLAGEFVDFQLEDLRAFVEANLGERCCHYCRGPVRVRSFALNARNPIERGGSYCFHNLAVVCRSCDEAKGVMDYVEFKEMWSVLRTWARPVQRRVLAQLRAGRRGPFPAHLPAIRRPSPHDPAPPLHGERGALAP